MKRCAYFPAVCALIAVIGGCASEPKAQTAGTSPAPANMVRVNGGASTISNSKFQAYGKLRL
jgi:hypothetical protein